MIRKCEQFLLVLEPNKAEIKYEIDQIGNLRDIYDKIYVCRLTEEKIHSTGLFSNCTFFPFIKSMDILTRAIPEKNKAIQIRNIRRNLQKKIASL